MTDTPDRPATPKEMTVPNQPPFGFVNLLHRAKKHISEATSFRVHPLRDTHTNDVPVNMALFAGEQIRNAVQAETERCCKAMCWRCNIGHDVVCDEEHGYIHKELSGFYALCPATAIREGEKE